MKLNRSFVPDRDGPRQVQTAVAELVDGARGQGGLVWRNWRTRLLLAMHDGDGRHGSWQALSLTRNNLVGLVMKLVHLLTAEEEEIALGRSLHCATWPLKTKIAEQETEIHRLRWRIHCLEADRAASVPRYSDRTALAVIGGAS
jgi:hypothetical protein